MNNWSGVGRIVKPTEIRYSQNGKAVSRNTIAITRKYKNVDGTFGTDFINIVLFGKTAELFANFVEKGVLVGVEGSIQTRDYEGQDGKRVYVTEVVVDQIHFLQPRKKEEQSTLKEENPFVEMGRQVESEYDISDSDLPF